MGVRKWAAVDGTNTSLTAYCNPIDTSIVTGTRGVHLLVLSISNMLSSNLVCVNGGNRRLGTFGIHSNCNVHYTLASSVRITVVAKQGTGLMRSHYTALKVARLCRKRSGGLVTFDSLLRGLTVTPRGITCINSSLVS